MSRTARFSAGTKGFRRRPRSSGTLTPQAARQWRRRWDLQQERGVRDREARFDAILEMLALTQGRRFRVLDLGCGTGSLSERVLYRFPQATSVAIDYDPVLLKIARTGLGTFGGRLTYVDADLRRPDWVERLPRLRFDAAVSTTALHWLTERQLRELYRGVAGLLRPGGWLVNGDHLGYPTRARAFDRLARSASGARTPAPKGAGESWEEWWSSVLHDRRFAAEAELHRRRYPHAHSGTPTPDLGGHVRLLRAAGFRAVDVVWSRWDNRVLAALR